MSSKFEVLLSNDGSGQLWNTCLWDPGTGSSLATYKGCVSAPRTTVVLGETFLISSQPTKPVLNVWQLNRREQRPVKQTTPGIVQALAASPNGKFLVLGIAEKIYLYQTCTGKLLNIIARHYQDVTQLAFTDDGSHFISCGADGNAFVWSLIGSTVAHRLPGQSSNDAVAKPRYHWSHHGLAITGLAVGSGGVRARVFTVSKDQTCKVYSLASGDLLLDVTFSVALTSVTVDLGQRSVFIGSASGPIYTFVLSSPPRDLKLTLTGDKKTNMFSGHTKEVNCLSVATDGQMLASGSLDFDVRLWHVASRQCIRVLGHKGPLSTVRFFSPPSSVFDTDSFKPFISLAPFEKTVIPIATGLQENYVLQVINDEEIELRDGAEVEDDFPSLPPPTSNRPEINSDSTFEVLKLKEINLQLYQHAAKKIFINGSK